MWVGKGYEYGKGPQAGCWLLLLAACKDYSQDVCLFVPQKQDGMSFSSSMGKADWNFGIKHLE